MKEVLQVDLTFAEPRATFTDLGFTQVDDYFGIPAADDEGDDIVVWLFPLVGGRIVDHHSGPFDGLRLSFNVLRNPVSRHAIFLDCLRQLGPRSSVPLEVAQVERDLLAAVAEWESRGVVVGSDEALTLN